MGGSSSSMYHPVVGGTAASESHNMLGPNIHCPPSSSIQQNVHVVSPIVHSGRSECRPSSSPSAPTGENVYVPSTRSSRSRPAKSSPDGSDLQLTTMRNCDGSWATSVAVGDDDVEAPAPAASVQRSKRTTIQSSMRTVKRPPGGENAPLPPPLVGGERPCSPFGLVCRSVMRNLVANVGTASGNVWGVYARG